MPDHVQYYLVDNTLGMRKGKVGAQCAHGALLADRLYQRLQNISLLDQMPTKRKIASERYLTWFRGEMKKIVLKGNPEILAKAISEYVRMTAVVIDNGHTEIPAGSMTVVVLPIMDKTNAPDWLKELKPL